MKQFIPSLLCLLFVAPIHGLPTVECPILGPTFPSGFNIAKSTAFKTAASTFPDQVEALFEAGLLNKTHGSFAIDVYSTFTNSSIYSYNHDGEALHEGLTTGVLDDNTIMRIGSVSKLFTVYAILAHAGIDVLNDPVIKYLPELAGNMRGDPLEKIIWEDVTVGALASQQGGTGGFTLNSAACFAFQNCTIEAFLTEMRDNKRPSMPVFQTALYSDSGFGVLGRVLERLTNLSYNDAITSVLGERLSLNHTSATLPRAEGFNGLIVPGDFTTSSWGFDNQITAPSGGIYSSNTDMRAVGLSILHSKILSATATRHWMKPQSHTAALTSSVGAPWEIERLLIPVSAESNRTRVSDLYTKAGGQAGYGTIFALSPDHGIGFSINAAGAGSGSARWFLRDIVGGIFIPAAELAGAENAAQQFAGTFIDDSRDGTNLTITVDDDKPGLGLETMYVEGIEYRPALFPGAEPGSIPVANLTVRLYPARLENGSLMKFRAVPEPVPSPYTRAAIEGGKGLFNTACTSWLNAAFLPDIDELVFEVVSGRLESVTSTSLGITMTRIE